MAPTPGRGPNSGALALAGVLGVYTQSDLESWGISRLPVGWCVPGQRVVDNALLADGRARYVGEPIAVVLAADPYLAEDAAELVDVEYEWLPGVANADDALTEDSILLYPEWGDNVLASITVGEGDTDAAFGRAEHVAAARFHVGRSTGMPMEPRGALARVDPDTGLLELNASIQAAHHARMDLAEVLSLPENAIRVIPPDVGGSFGVKDHLSAEDAVVSVLAHRTGRAVKWVEDRVEHLAACVHSREQIYHVELAADANGKVLGLRGRLLLDAGATSGNHGI